MFWKELKNYLKITSKNARRKFLFLLNEQIINFLQKLVGVYISTSALGSRVRSYKTEMHLLNGPADPVIGPLIDKPWQVWDRDTPECFQNNIIQGRPWWSSS